MNTDARLEGFVSQFLEGGWNNLSYLNHFTQPDSIIPNPGNPLDWNRYAYVRYNPLRYNDLSGHYAIAAAAFLFHPVTALLVGALVIATLHNVLPGREERTAALAQVFDQAQTAINGIFAHPTTSNPELANAVSTSSQQVNTAESNALLMKGEYVPPWLSERERQAYREAVHLYKDKVWKLPKGADVPKDILDRIADAIKDGSKPIDAAEDAPMPPDGDLKKPNKDKKTETR